MDSMVLVKPDDADLKEIRKLLADGAAAPKSLMNYIDSFTFSLLETERRFSFRL